MAGLALPVARTSAFQPGTRRRIVVAGGGILGANIAYRLASRGAAVTLLERRRPGHGTTANSFAWINAQKQPHPYFTLNHLGIEAWRVLDQETAGELPIVWGGRLEWITDAARAARAAEINKRYQSWGYPVHAIDAARLRAMEPRAKTDGLVAAWHAASEASVDPVAATEMILARAAAAGATVRQTVEVTGLDRTGGRLRAVKTSGGDIEADVLVIACGNDTPAVAAMAGLQVPLSRSPGILVHTAPQPPLMSHLLLTPLGQIKQKKDGRIVTGADFGPSGSEDTSRATGEAFLQRMAAVLPELGRAPLDKVTLGLRVMPKDGYPIVGFPKGHRDVYVTAMHSGITLGPLIGRLAAIEILDQVEVDLLAPYRLERFDSAA